MLQCEGRIDGPARRAVAPGQPRGDGRDRESEPVPQTPSSDHPSETFDAVRRIVAESYRNVVLVLQGGGALGSYQAGVVEELDGV